MKTIKQEDIISYVNKRFAILVAERDVIPDKIPEVQKRHPAIKQLEGRIKELRKLRKWLNGYVNTRVNTKTR